jgi:uncharacterized cupin superfamily protein
MEETMPEIFRPDDLKFKKNKFRIPEFVWHTSSRLGNQVNSKYLGFDIRSLDPGKFSFPYHFHRAAEELFVILAGEATLRSPEGFQKVFQGDVIFFEEGPSGAHQLYNHSNSACMFVDIRTTKGIDVCEYPDSGKLSILPKLEVFENSSQTDYFTGEEHVSEKWPDEILNPPAAK